MKPSGLGKKIERLAKQADKTPAQWLADYINEHGSITAAAPELKVSRQALSAMCAKLGVSVTTTVKREFSVKDEYTS